MIYPDIELEKKLWSSGKKIVVGLDEVGRGPLAGPVVAGALVITGEECVVQGVRDSKKMSLKQRECSYNLIVEKSTAYGIGVVDSDEIDRIGIKYAVLSAMKEAVAQVENKLGRVVDYIIADGGIYPLRDYDIDILNKGDMYHYSIAGASVLAKVTRDRIMTDYASVYPMYGFERNVGYGTREHIEAIQKFGICEIHRKTFEPIKSMLRD